MSRQTSPAPAISGRGIERLALPHATDRADDGGSSPFVNFTRLALRAADGATGNSPPSVVAVLVVDEPSGYQLAAFSGEVRGELLPVSILRAQMSRPRRITVEIPDIRTDIEFGPLSHEESQAGFAGYAGATIRSPSGQAIGILCLLDRDARRYGRDIALTLADLSRGVGALLALQRAAVPADSASTGTVTALPGRHALIHYLDHAIGEQTPAGTGAGLALLRIEVGRLAGLNETYGREIADRVLKQAADRLRTIAPLPTFLAHFGGSGFALVAPGRVTATEAEAIVLRMMDRLREPVQVDLLELKLLPSIGFALHPMDGTDSTSLLLSAEAALGHAKRQGEGRHQRANSMLSAAYTLSTGLEQDLQAAVAAGAFHLNWMPTIDTATDRIVSFEALVRWNRPGHGEVSPSLFIPVAETGGLVEQIDAWVLRAACVEAQSWDQPLRVSVNMSPIWLSHGRLVRLLHRVLEETGLDPTRLQVELSQRSAAFEDDVLRRELSQLRAMGVSLALDDFGAGYSCLTTLGTFPFDQVKLDRQFVQSLGRDRRAETITRSVLHMVQSLGMTSCAEGVETEEQLAFLDAHGCEEIQGYLIGRPMPVLPKTMVLATEVPGIVGASSA